MNLYRLSGGQFVEEHDQPDMLALLQQIGAVPKAQAGWCATCAPADFRRT